MDDRGGVSRSGILCIRPSPRDNRMKCQGVVAVWRLFDRLLSN